MPDLIAASLLEHIGKALQLAFLMLWATFWSLMLGLILSAVIQVLVSKGKIAQLLGGSGFKEIATATLFGAASSSCSYAAVAMGKTLFSKGAHLIAVLAFMFASTNLVIELSFVLWNLLGPVFVLAEISGGVLLVLIMSAVVKLTYPKRLVDAARKNIDMGGHDHQAMMQSATGTEMGSAMTSAMGAGKMTLAMEPSTTWQQKLTSRNGWTQIAQAFVMDWKMLRKEVLIGFSIAGFIGVFVPTAAWQIVFAQGGPAWFKLVENALVGPIIAVISFVCSVGNIPMAAVLWQHGIGFGGVIAFIFADLLVLPIVNLYRKYYGLPLAAYISAVLFATMVITGILVDLIFGAVGIIPAQSGISFMDNMHIEFNYTCVLNVIFFCLALILGYLDKTAPANDSPHCCH